MHSYLAVFYHRRIYNFHMADCPRKTSLHSVTMKASNLTDYISFYLLSTSQEEHISSTIFLLA